MTLKHTTREYVLFGLFSLLAAFPLVGGTTALSANVFGEHGEQAIEEREHQRILRRMRWSVISDCTVREGEGEEGVCPDQYDYNSLYQYWVGDDVEEDTDEDEDEDTNDEDQDENDEKETSVMAVVEELSGIQRNLLRRATRTGQCPEDLDEMLPGFQSLCAYMIGAGDERLDLLLEATNKLRGSAPSQHFRTKTAD